MNEKKWERKLIATLRSSGFYAVHMDTGVSGFPDIFCVHKGAVGLVEVKDASRKARKAFEPSQAPFYYTMRAYGFLGVFVAFCNEKTCALFEPLQYFPFLVATYSVAVDEIKARIHGKPDGQRIRT